LWFTVRRSADAEVSACGHRPSGGNIACSVDVGVAWSSGTGLALEHRLALAVSGSDVPTHRAALRRVGGRILLDPTGSFLLQPRCAQAPTTTADPAIKTSLLGDLAPGLLDSSARAAHHRPHIKGFNANRVETTRDISAELSTQSVRRAASRAFSFAIASLVRAPIRGALRAGQTLLQHPRPRSFTTTQAWDAPQITGRQSRRHRNPAVDAHHRTISRAGDLLRDMRERHTPAPHHDHE
jgi:hypothetical protein